MLVYIVLLFLLLLLVFCGEYISMDKKQIAKNLQLRNGLKSMERNIVYQHGLFFFYNL